MKNFYGKINDVQISQEEDVYRVYSMSKGLLSPIFLTLDELEILNILIVQALSHAKRLTE